MNDSSLNRWRLIALAASLLFVLALDRVKALPRHQVNVEMQVVIPLAVQVAMAAGDRYLAANMAGIRALVSSTENMRENEYRVLARGQDDVAWLNPAHEDNYDTAAAILPWSGELEAAQTILARATDARPFDYLPAFYYGFHLLHFKHDPVGASEWLRRAAEKLPEGDDRLTMQNFAAQWMDRSRDIDLAIRVVDGMARQAKRKDFRAYLEMRVERLRGLKQVRAAAEVFRQRFARPLADPAELVRSGLLPDLPADPFGFGFAIDKRGEVVLRNSPPPS